MQALFCEITKGSGWFWGAVLGIIVISATFFVIYLAYGLVLGAVLGISAVTATFLGFYPVLGLNFRSCFKRFSDYSSPRSAYYAINPL